MDYLFSALIILGVYLTGDRKTLGWIVSAVGNLGYIYIAIEKEFYGLFIVSITMLILSIINYIRWKK